MITNLVKDFRCELDDENHLTVNLSDNYLVGKKVILKTSFASECVVLGTDQLHDLIQFLQQCKNNMKFYRKVSSMTLTAFRCFGCELNEENWVKFEGYIKECSISITIEPYYNSSEPIVLGSDQLDNLIQFLQQCKNNMEFHKNRKTEQNY